MTEIPKGAKIGEPVHLDIYDQPINDGMTLNERLWATRTYGQWDMAIRTESLDMGIQLCEELCWDKVLVDWYIQALITSHKTKETLPQIQDKISLEERLSAAKRTLEWDKAIALEEFAVGVKICKEIGWDKVVVRWYFADLIAKRKAKDLINNN